MDDEALARTASKVGHRRYGTAGAVVAGAAAGALIGYRVALAREERSTTSRGSRRSDSGPADAAGSESVPDIASGTVASEIATAALDAVTERRRPDADRSTATGGSGVVGDADHVRPEEGVDVPVDDGEQDGEESGERTEDDGDDA
jgi:hypothetical protein